MSSSNQVKMSLVSKALFPKVSGNAFALSMTKLLGQDLHASCIHILMNVKIITPNTEINHMENCDLISTKFRPHPKSFLEKSCKLEVFLLLFNHEVYREKAFPKRESKDLSVPKYDSRARTTIAEAPRS